MKWERDQVRAFFDSHWTVRKYRDFAIPTEDLDVIIEAAQRAPTDATAQMYSFVRLKSQELRAHIATLAHNPHIQTASECFVVCADMHRLNKILESEGHEPGYFPHVAIHFAIGDAVLAGQNLLLAAEMLGYRGCWIGGVLAAPSEISTRLKLPDGVFPFGALTIGLPDESPKKRPRIARNQVFHEDHYSVPTDDEINAAKKKMAPITRRGDWAQTLARYFAKGGSMEEREVLLRELLNQRIFKK